MKKLMILILTILTTSVVEARITDADIDRINAEARANLLRTMPNALNPEIAQADIEQKWRLYNQPPEEVNSSNVVVTRYSVSNSATRLQPINTHICTLAQIGGFYGRGLKGIDVNVYQSAGYWWLSARHDSGGSSNWGEATCWNKQ